MKFVGRAIEILQALRNKETAGAEITHDAMSTARQESKVREPEALLEKLPPTEPQPSLLRDPVLTLSFPVIDPGANANDEAIALSNALHNVLHTALQSDKSQEKLKLTEPKTISEPNFPGANSQRASSQISYHRWRASTEEQSLSVRARDGVVELFIVKTDDIALLSFSEFGSRLKGRFDLVRTGTGYSCWMIGKVAARADVAAGLINRCLRELLGEPGASSTTIERAQTEAPGDSVQQLILEKQNLIFKVINQQEIIKNDIARNLHDTVLADLLMLKRHMRGDRELSKDEIIEAIDEISQQLRDICNECAPRNLHDWGLKTSIQDLLQRMEQRTGIKCSLACDLEIPNLPDTVELHIFRLIQECLNNAEKHAKASKVTITIERSQEKSIKFKISDNGTGFVPTVSEKSIDSGGMGVTGMRERVALIRCFFPTEFSIESQPGLGTTAHLEITLPSLNRV